MKVLIAAGGTGGHIYPGVAIAKHILSVDKNSKIKFVGTNKGLEKDLIPKEGFPIELIRVKGFKRKLSIDTFKSVKELFLGIRDANKLLLEYKPDIVIGTGGYVCGPILFMASRKGIPTLIHEQNAFPGVTNRILSNFVDKIALSFLDSKKYFNKKRTSKIFISGNPIRKDFEVIDRYYAREKMKLNNDTKYVISLGGSQGALTINKSIVDVIDYFKGDVKVRITHITGKNQYDNFINMLKERKIDINKYSNIEILPYSFDIPTLFNAADLIISRAGAMSVSEIAAVGCPSILIPYPYATDNHQEYNARVITDKNGGILILDNQLNGQILRNSIKELLYNEHKLKKMASITTDLAELNANIKIYKEIENLINHK